LISSIGKGKRQQRNLVAEYSVQRICFLSVSVGDVQYNCRLAWNLIPLEYTDAIATGTTLRYVSIAVFVLVSGVAADRFGRKQPIIIGLIMSGLSFALLDFFGITQANIILYLALSGIPFCGFPCCPG